MDIVVIGGTRWSEEVNQPPQQAVRALVDRGHRVFYVFRELQSSALRNLVHPVDERGRGEALRLIFRSTRVQRVQTGLWVASIGGMSAAMPMSHPELSRRNFVRRLRRWLAEEASRLGMDAPVYWFYWWFLPELAEGAPGCTVYDVIDDHTGYAANDRLGRANERAAELERRMLHVVDNAFAVSSHLVAQKSGATDRIELLPNAVDVRRIQASLAVPDRPRDLAKIEGPIIGYAGDLGERLDWDLVNELAARQPQWSIVMVGGKRPAGAADLENLYVLPGRPYAEILRCMREFDVALIPLRKNDFNRSVSSLKLLDYLAVGKPVVAADLPFVHDVTDRRPHLVSIAGGVEDWEQAVANRLAKPDSPAEIRQRQEILDSRSTHARVEKILASLA